MQCKAFYLPLILSSDKILIVRRLLHSDPTISLNCIFNKTYYEEETRMADKKDGWKDKAKGLKDKVVGGAKDTYGDVTDDKSKQVEGKSQKAKGGVEKKIGEFKDDIDHKEDRNR